MEQTAIARQLRTFIEETFLFGRSDGLGDADSFLEQGIIDSTGILELMEFLQERYGIRVEDEEAIPDNLDSIARVSAYLSRKVGDRELSFTAGGRGARS